VLGTGIRWDCACVSSYGDALPQMFCHIRKQGLYFLSIICLSNFPNHHPPTCQLQRTGTREMWQKKTQSVNWAYRGPQRTLNPAKKVSCNPAKIRINSGWVGRTPVSPHPNCKKHLKKGTKVDAEYSSPTWVPKTRVNWQDQTTYPNKRTPCSPRVTTWPAQYLHQNNHQLELCSGLVLLVLLKMWCRALRSLVYWKGVGSLQTANHPW
jgi:hypothetical protein